MVTAKGFLKIRRTVAHDYKIRGVAQGACGLKRFSWNANTREVSQKYIGFVVSCLVSRAVVSGLCDVGKYR